MTASTQQRNLFTRRWQTVRAPDPSELQLQISLVEWCRWKLRPDVLMWHTPNGEERDKRTAAKLKAMGVLPGVADLVFMWGFQDRAPAPADGRDDHKIVPAILFLELKASGRKQSVEQSAFGLAALTMGAGYHVVDDVDEATRIIESYGLTRKTGRQNDLELSNRPAECAEHPMD